MKRRDLKIQNIIQLVLVLAIIILINFIGSYAFFKIDLTADNRYTLSDRTEKMLEDLDDIVFIRVYLEGNMPVGFEKLNKSAHELIQQFQDIAGDNIGYEFVNPSSNPDKYSRDQTHYKLYKKGLYPIDVYDKGGEGTETTTKLFPGAILSYRDKEVVINFLKNNKAFSTEQNLNNSAQDLEYLFNSAIKRLKTKDKQKIAFVEGHGELEEIKVASITNSLEEFYVVDRVRLNGQLASLDGYSAIIIAKPDSVFDEKDKFIIDQFIMNGGKSLWLVDPVIVAKDSLQNSNFSMAIYKQLNIEDQLFNYGVRINPNLIQDAMCSYVPVNDAYAGMKDNFVPKPWFYFPLLLPQSDHPIVKNINSIRTEFVSTVDSVGKDKNVKKTFLLHSSNYSKVVNAPVRINLSLINEKIDKKHFTEAYKPLGLLLEGEFKSNYVNRVPSKILESKEINFKEKSKPTKMIVVGDGDIIRNYVVPDKGEMKPLALGADGYYNNVYYSGNTEFIMNAVNYLCDDDDIMNVRSKDLTLRILDRERIQEEGFLWKLLNIVSPIVLLLIFGIILTIVRKRKYL